MTPHPEWSDLPDQVAVAVRHAVEHDVRESPPWWTEADQAELDALTHELVDGVFDHRPRCASCARGHPPCPHVREAIEIVIGWKRRRLAVSYARWLRRQRELLEIARDRLDLQGTPWR